MSLRLLIGEKHNGILTSYPSGPANAHGVDILTELYADTVDQLLIKDVKGKKFLRKYIWTSALTPSGAPSQWGWVSVRKYQSLKGAVGATLCQNEAEV